MGVIRNVPFGGSSLSYWRIVKFVQSYKIEIVLGGYFDKIFREGHSEPLLEEVFDIHLYSDLSELSGKNHLEFSYEKLRELYGFVSDEEPVVQEPVVQEPVVQEPVVQEPVVQEPVVQEPVVQEPVVQEPADEEE